MWVAFITIGFVLINLALYGIIKSIRSRANLKSFYRVVLLLLLVAFLALGGFAWYSLSTKAHLLAQSSIQEIQDSNNHGLKYRIKISKGGWYDTGIWVAANKLVSVANENGSPQQPFILKVNGNIVPASLKQPFVFPVPPKQQEEKERFISKLFTVVSGGTLDWPKDGWPVFAEEMDTISRVGISGQTRIYLKVDDEAQADELTLILSILP